MKQSLAIIYNNLRQHTGGRSLWQLNLILNTVNPFHSSRILVLSLEEALLNFSLSNTCTKSTGLERRLFTVLFLLEFFVSTWPAILYKVKQTFSPEITFRIGFLYWSSKLPFYVFSEAHKRLYILRFFSPGSLLINTVILHFLVFSQKWSY